MWKMVLFFWGKKRESFVKAMTFMGTKYAVQIERYESTTETFDRIKAVLDWNEI